MNQCTQLLAASIMAGMKAHEDSYDKVASDAATTKADDHNRGLLGGPSDPAWEYVDFSSFYRMTLREAVESVAGELSEPVYLLLNYAPNDAQDWAVEQLKPALPATEGATPSYQPDAVADHAKVVKCEAAMGGYYEALDNRKHGGDAQHIAFRAIEDALGMSWNQGATLNPKG